MEHCDNDMADILTSNIIAMKDQIGDPEKMVRQIIQDMEETLSEAKQNASESMASESRFKLEQEVIQMEKELDFIKQKAMALKISQMAA